MPSVYDENNFKGRVNLAASYISAVRESTRSFDTCFEMYDGDAVAVALFRRAKNNPTGKLAHNIWTRLDRTSVTELAEKYRDIPTRELPDLAARLRAKARVDFQRFLDGQKQKGWIT